MKVKLMYGPGSGEVVEVGDRKEWLYPVIRDPKLEDVTSAGQLQAIPVVRYGPRIFSGNIWYPRDVREYYVGKQWDGFRPDGAPSPSDAPR